MKTISFHTLGCRLNQSETAVIENTFAGTNFRTVGFDQPADIAVINTCTVTENGDADTRRLVNRAVRLNPGVRIALIGCQAQIQKEQLLKMPNVIWVIGNAGKMDLMSILRDTPDDAAPRVLAPAIPRSSFTVPAAGIDARHTRANLKIQDGCDFFCSFCEIPYARGRARSREFHDILSESRALAAAGHKELVITGINAGTYNFEGHRLADVLEALEGIEGLERIRISSIEPTTVPLKIFERMADPRSKLCRHLHIPLQSGDDAVLAAMKRLYTVAEFDRFIKEARARAPEICVGTDVIVGFPGETEASFQNTAAYLREAPVDYFHVFSYSRRQLAKSRLQADPVPQSVIADRSRILRDLSRRKRALFLQKLAGTRQRVLFEEEKKGYWTGITDHYARVVTLSDTPLRNRFVDVDIQSARPDYLIGTLAGGEA
jgi:threonylcarbamoyladenosine tRNA methylthiotransferase MtaB